MPERLDAAVENSREISIMEQGLIHGWMGLITVSFAGYLGWDMLKTGALIGFYVCGSMAMGYTHGEREPTKPLHFSYATIFFPAYLGHLCAGGTAKIRCSSTEAADDEARMPLLPQAGPMGTV